MAEHEGDEEMGSCATGKCRRKSVDDPVPSVVEATAEHEEDEDMSDLHPETLMKVTS